MALVKPSDVIRIESRAQMLVLACDVAILAGQSWRLHAAILHLMRVWTCPVSQPERWTELLRQIAKVETRITCEWYAYEAEEDDD